LSVATSDMLQNGRDKSSKKKDKTKRSVRNLVGKEEKNRT